MGALRVLALLQAFDPQVVPTGNTAFFFWTLFKMVVVFSVIVFNLLVDIAYAVLDPRIRYA